MAVATQAFLFFSLIVILNSLKVIPERSEVTYVNTEYFSFLNLTVKRHGRKSNYYLNLEAENLQEINNNISLHLIFSEFLHNEFRRSFVEMHFNHLCHDLAEDPFVGRLLSNSGFKCPVPPGIHRYMNLTVPTDDFHNIWPFQRGRVEGSLVAFNRIILGNASTVFTFVNEMKKKKRPH